MTGALAAEWIKLRSVRSTCHVLAVVAAVLPLVALMAWNGATGWDSGTPEERAAWERAQPLEEAVLPFVQLCAAVLGIMAITSEYATGTIRASLTAVPSRRTALAAKAGAVAAVSLAMGLVAVFAMHGIARLVIGGRPLADYDEPFSDAVPLLLSSGVSVAVVALVGLGVGTALRSTAGALVVVCGLLFVLPVVPAFLPSPWGERLAGVTVSDLAVQSAGGADDPLLPPLAACAVMAAYVGIALGSGAALLLRRDQ
ncbi:ABC transporter permease [Actinomadura rubrobrunea]|uniref:ABC transporter permease n=1 Tax=Actinomadura rubrobrunea TaxID=115335 RepID=A0A9W6Q1G2_9ACTN|nr:ABC transporter permease subunit [Actinomadura rubrobrunea]GLW66522.1 ABC transporter permease [Actinomadura rubrobrunea]